MIEPVKKEITVPVPPAHAFKVFTDEFANWWPVASHSLSGSAGKLPKTVTVTPGIGGKIVEKMHDGSLATWGVISEWEPGRKLAFSWHLRCPKDEQTHVCVEFFPDGTGTRVSLIHWGWEAIGDDAASSREQYDSGWDFVLGECFAGAAT